MGQIEFFIHFPCPYRGCKGETLADGQAKVKISVVCAKCGRAYIIDLDTGRIYEAKPQRRTS